MASSRSQRATSPFSASRTAARAWRKATTGVVVEASTSSSDFATFSALAVLVFFVSVASVSGADVSPASPNSPSFMS